MSFSICSGGIPGVEGGDDDHRDVDRRKEVHRHPHEARHPHHAHDEAEDDDQVGVPDRESGHGGRAVRASAAARARHRPGSRERSFSRRESGRRCRTRRSRRSRSMNRRAASGTCPATLARGCSRCRRWSPWMISPVSIRSPATVTGAPDLEDVAVGVGGGDVAGVRAAARSPRIFRLPRTAPVVTTPTNPERLEDAGVHGPDRAPRVPGGRRRPRSRGPAGPGGGLDRSHQSGCSR